MAIDAVLSGVKAQQPLLSRGDRGDVGNVLEWFDFLIYGYFAVMIAEVFSPAGNRTISLLVTFGAFGLPMLSGRWVRLWLWSAVIPIAPAGWPV
jgi:hypothetical protein